MIVLMREDTICKTNALLVRWPTPPAKKAPKPPRVEEKEAPRAQKKIPTITPDEAKDSEL